VALAASAVAEAGRRGAALVCFPECFVPGYRWPGRPMPPPDPQFLERAWSTVADAARQAGIGVVLGTERVTERGLQISALVLNSDGTAAGWQDKGQIDPAEELIYPALNGERCLFRIGMLTFGIVICHEGFRYPETVRWAARRGAQVVFHPYAYMPEPGHRRPARFADATNSFHEGAILCRAAENGCYVASVTCPGEAGTMTSAFVNPDGTVLCHQPYGEAGLLVADLDLTAATGLLASRCRTSPL
jgi:predicted amidohydrolase